MVSFGLVYNSATYLRTYQHQGFFTGFSCTSGFVCLHIQLFTHVVVTGTVLVSYSCCHGTMFSVLVQVKLLLPVVPWELLWRWGMRELNHLGWDSYFLRELELQFGFKHKLNINNSLNFLDRIHTLHAYNWTHSGCGLLSCKFTVFGQQGVCKMVECLMEDRLAD